MTGGVRPVPWWAGSPRARRSVAVLKDGISALSDFDQALALRQTSFLYSGKVATAAAVAFE